MGCGRNGQVPQPSAGSGPPAFGWQSLCLAVLLQFVALDVSFACFGGGAEVKCYSHPPEITMRPTSTTEIIVSAGVVALFLSAACQTSSRECERARLETHRAYRTLAHAATQRKLSGVDTDRWAKVENKTDLLQSAFATTQVTWRSAEKARGEVRENIESIATDNPISLEIFKRSAEEAFKLQQEFAERCR